jgi:hypothetical protein
MTSMYCGAPVLDQYGERIRYCIVINQQTFLFCSISLSALDFLCSGDCGNPIAAFGSRRMFILQCTHDKYGGMDDILCDFISINSEIVFSSDAPDIKGRIEEKLQAHQVQAIPSSASNREPLNLP